MDLMHPPCSAPRHAYVLPGEVHVATAPTRFTTLLGSCVAVCLYDAGQGIGGLNHFLLPGAADFREGSPLRWSEPSMGTLLARLVAAGARPRHLEAKVFGGAHLSDRNMPDRLRVGARNIASALDALQRQGISLANHHTGGHRGRKLIFESHTGVVWLKELINHPSPAPAPSGIAHLHR